MEMSIYLRDIRACALDGGQESRGHIDGSPCTFFRDMRGSAIIACLPRIHEQVVLLPGFLINNPLMDQIPMQGRPNRRMFCEMLTSQGKKCSQSVEGSVIGSGTRRIRIRLDEMPRRVQCDLRPFPFRLGEFGHAAIPSLCAFRYKGQSKVSYSRADTGLALILRPIWSASG